MDFDLLARRIGMKRSTIEDVWRSQAAGIEAYYAASIDKISVNSYQDYLGNCLSKQLDTEFQQKKLVETDFY